MLVDSGRSHISLSWGKPYSCDAAPVLAYKIDAWLVGADGGARWTELGISPISSYDAFNLKPGHQYHFRVTPKNRYGWGKSVQTTVPILVGGAQCLPEFTQILPAQIKALIDMDLTLECVVRATPRPGITWYKDGTELLLPNGGDDRIVLNVTSSMCKLRIQRVRAEDAGRYTCEASNSQGRAMTFVRLQVVSDARIYEADTKLKTCIQSDMVGYSAFSSTIIDG